jgi:beta-lactamase regulating signal transducer with metallopeptidase domain
MFAVRGIAVSSAIFVLLYSALSLVVCGVWRILCRRRHRDSGTHSADFLFILRMAPFILAVGATLLFAVPSFLLLEPRAVNESMSDATALLGVCGIAVLLAGTWNALRALARTSRMVARWSREAGPISSKPVDSQLSVSVFRTSAVAPPLTASGILHSSVWLSRAAEFVLTERELESALRHEVVHVRRRDNLRKLMLRLVAFPGMEVLDTAWREATEMAADDAAVSSASEALDLAAAVIKLSRLAPLDPPSELTTALVHSPAESVNARVERLITWTERRQIPARKYSSAFALCAAAVVTITLAASYPQLLTVVHTATEWLVR